jgi:hypothetical protein
MAWCRVRCVRCPAGVLRSTFRSLLREAPCALLAQQLRSGAAEPCAWWRAKQTFTASAATGSMVGWLLGLGDRHMDNLLLDRCVCVCVWLCVCVCVCVCACACAVGVWARHPRL